MEHTTSRLRKTFRYPVDGDEDDDLPEALDEEEQETLIRALNQQNATRNAQYRLALLSLPALSIIPYLITLTTPHLTLLSLLSITSLLSTAYLLYILPPGTTSIPFLDNLSHQRPHPPPKPRPFTGFGIEDESPIRRYLPYLNLGLNGVLLVLGALVRRKVDAEGAWWWGFNWLPMGVYTVVLLAKWIMGSVDPEGELGSLRYEFKGA